MKKFYLILAMVAVLVMFSGVCKADGMTRVKSFCNTHIDEITSAIEELAWENKFLM